MSELMASGGSRYTGSMSSMDPKLRLSSGVAHRGNFDDLFTSEYGTGTQAAGINGRGRNGKTSNGKPNYVYDGTL